MKRRDEESDIPKNVAHYRRPHKPETSPVNFVVNCERMCSIENFVVNHSEVVRDKVCEIVRIEVVHEEVLEVVSKRIIRAAAGAGTCLRDHRNFRFTSTVDEWVDPPLVIRTRRAYS